jgi:hypothetical protein
MLIDLSSREQNRKCLQKYAINPQTSWKTRKNKAGKYRIYVHHNEQLASFIVKIVTGGRPSLGRTCTI